MWVVVPLVLEVRREHPLGQTTDEPPVPSSVVGVWPGDLPAQHQEMPEKGASSAVL